MEREVELKMKRSPRSGKGWLIKFLEERKTRNREQEQPEMKWKRKTERDRVGSEGERVLETFARV